jgi:predicted small secreted protein
MNLMKTIIMNVRRIEVMRRILLPVLILGSALSLASCGKPDNTASGYWIRLIALFSDADYQEPSSNMKILPNIIRTTVWRFRLYSQRPNFKE